MNVLFVSVLPLWSGETQAAGGPAFSNTVEAYIGAGHHCYLITTEPSNLRLARAKLDVTVVPGKLPRLPGKLLVNFVRYLLVFPIATLSRFLWLSRSIKFDLFYGYEVEGIIAAWLAKLVTGLPMVARYQGTVLGPIVLRPSSLKQKVSYLIYILGFKAPADLAIMGNDGTQGDRVMQKLNPRLAQRMVFWRNGSDPIPPSAADFDLRARLGVAPDSILLLTVSRLVHWKRVDRAIHALPLVLKHAPAVELIVVGGGPELNSLERLARELGVEQKVHFAGMVPHAEVLSFYKQCDLFLSLYDLSNLGNPLMEAMRSGIPVVTLNNGDTASVIQNGATGLLLDSGSPAEVAEAVLRLVADPQLRLQIGKSAQDFAQAHFWTWQERMDRELQLVDRVARRHDWQPKHE